MWWLDVYVGEGRKRVRKSTHTSDKVRARIIEQSVVAVNRNITSRQRAMMIIDNVLPERERSLSLAEAPEFYRKCAEDEGLVMTKCSMEHRVNILSKFAMWAHENSRISFVEEVNATLAFEFVKYLGPDLTAKTKNAYVSDLGTSWKMFMRHNKAENNPWPIVRVPRNKSEEASGRAFTQDEISRLMIAAGNAGHDWQTTIMIGLYTGLRLGDATSLKWSDIDFKKGILQYCPSKTRKHDIVVRVPLHRVLVEWLEGHRNESAHVTPARVGRTRRTGFKDGDKTFTELLADAGISNGGDNVKLSFHCFRHTFVSRLAEAGVAPDVRMRLVGHTSTMNHAIYTHDDVSSRGAIDTLPDISYTAWSQKINASQNQAQNKHAS